MKSTETQNLWIASMTDNKHTSIMAFTWSLLLFKTNRRDVLAYRLLRSTIFCACIGTILVIILFSVTIVPIRDNFHSKRPFYTTMTGTMTPIDSGKMFVSIQLFQSIEIRKTFLSKGGFNC